MSRILFALAFLLPAAALLAQPTAAPAPTRSLVYAISDTAAVDGFTENPAITRRMTERLICGATQQRNIAQAFRSLVKPQDRVGIKVSTIGGPMLSSHRGVVESILSGLEQAGIPRTQVVIWDRNMNDLKAAGFVETTGGAKVRAIDPPRGYDPAAKMVAPILGKLIWGDLLFRGKGAGLARLTDDEGLSAESHLPTVLSRDVTKIINVAVLSDEPGCGIAGAMYNVTVSALDNNRRFSQPQGASSIPDLYDDPRIGPKVVLSILDGLVAQYASGPGFHANYAYAHHTLYASKDPVALDATALRLMEGWRAESKLPPIGRRAAWLEEAQEAGVGFSSEDKIDVRAVSQIP